MAECFTHWNDHGPACGEQDRTPASRLCQDAQTRELMVRSMRQVRKSDIVSALCHASRSIPWNDPELRVLRVVGLHLCGREQAAVIRERPEPMLDRHGQGRLHLLVVARRELTRNYCGSAMRAWISLRTRVMGNGASGRK